MPRFFCPHKNVKDNWSYLLGLFVFSILFVVVYSTSTSYLYDYPETSDSFVFQVLGKNWVKGSIPYRDLFDNKGPFLYAMNALGYWLIDNKTGMLLVQIPFFFLTSFITFHFLQIGFNKKQSFWLTFALLLGLAFGYNGGNNACEYSLPFILLSFYFFYLWLDESTHKEIKHPLHYNFIYGVAIGFCLMTRPSNAIVVLMIVAYIIFNCILNKQFKELILNFFLVTMGCLAICLPFIVYFMANNCLDDFYYALIVSNMHYLKNTGLCESPMYLKRAIALVLSYINCLIFLVIGIFQIFCNCRKKNGYLWAVMSVLCILFFVKTNCYPNYAQICLPFAAIGLLELKNIYEKSKGNQYKRSLGIVITFCVIFFNFSVGVYSFIKNAVHDNSSQKALYSAYDTILNKIPKEGYGSFVSYECLPEMLLRWNICPNYRFFALQGFSCNYNHDVFDKTNDEFINGEAKWILINYWKGLPAEIQKTLNDRYLPQERLISEDAVLVLYKKRTNHNGNENW